MEEYQNSSVQLVLCKSLNEIRVTSYVRSRKLHLLTSQNMWLDAKQNKKRNYYSDEDDEDDIDDGDYERIEHDKEKHDGPQGPGCKQTKN